jgi:hypothetical protein
MDQLVDREFAVFLGALQGGDVVEDDAHAIAERKQAPGEPARPDDDRHDIAAEWTMRKVGELPEGGIGLFQPFTRPV